MLAASKRSASRGKRATTCSRGLAGGPTATPSACRVAAAPTVHSSANAVPRGRKEAPPGSFTLPQAPPGSDLRGLSLPTAPDGARGGRGGLLGLLVGQWQRGLPDRLGGTWEHLLRDKELLVRLPGVALLA
ncbi:hypothetical protein CDD82_5730 [Ophiocordyceps australis]|uniref:Uncharacterized protein n=1 Tax=Ophiocordyceps australis TaxID=1399860 RepID=A0A2C5YTT1_9HYPO|nr:hypothetical protein CDD82_5730 [Ophiocordyceps australis]